MIVKESINFERGLDPKEAMKIGTKLYRCGRCGTYTDPSGNPLDGDDFQEMERIDKIYAQFGEATVKLVNGNCCQEDERSVKMIRDPLCSLRSY